MSKESAAKVVHAKVARPNYVYAGNSLPKGTVVRMTEELFARTQRVKPSNFARITDAEAAKARTVMRAK
ncbi:MAG: hypothetical protein ACYC28_12070, partial [Longimicrobiales bacterium]